MKKILALALFITFNNSFAQTLDELKANTQTMYASSVTMNLEKIMDLTYPKVFEIVDRETLMGMMKGMFDNENMKITLVDLKPMFNYSAIKDLNGQKFSVIRYRNAMTMEFKSPMSDEMAKTIESNMKASGKFDKVTFDKTKNAITAEGDAVMIGVADASTQNKWTFVNYDDENLFNMIFDEKIKAELGL